MTNTHHANPFLHSHKCLHAQTTTYSAHTNQDMHTGVHVAFFRNKPHTHLRVQCPAEDGPRAAVPPVRFSVPPAPRFCRKTALPFRLQLKKVCGECLGFSSLRARECRGRSRETEAKNIDVAGRSGAARARAGLASVPAGEAGNNGRPPGGMQR